MSTLSVATLQSNTTTPPVIQNSSGTEIGRFCRAWVNFDGTGTVTIRAAFNVSSITDNGTGNYTANFTNAMPDANYATIGTVSGSLNTTLGVLEVLTAGVLTGSVQFHVADQTSGASDPAVVNLAVFR